MRRVALAVGVNRYEDDGINSLSCCAMDAMAVANALRLQLGFDEVEYLAEGVSPGPVNTDVVMAHIRQLGKGLRQDDLFVFYFAGHGKTHRSPGQAADHLLLLSGVPLNLLSRGSLVGVPGLLSCSAIQAETDAWPGVQRLLVVDACRTPLEATPAHGRGAAHSVAVYEGGAVLRDLLLHRQPVAPTSNRASSRGPMAVFNSCQDGQQAEELPHAPKDKGGGHGRFTAALLAELQQAAPTLADASLAQRVQARMQALGSGADRGQTPLWLGDAVRLRLQVAEVDPQAALDRAHDIKLLRRARQINDEDAWKHVRMRAELESTQKAAQRRLERLKPKPHAPTFGKNPPSTLQATPTEVPPAAVDLIHVTPVLPPTLKPAAPPLPIPTTPATTATTDTPFSTGHSSLPLSLPKLLALFEAQLATGKLRSPAWDCCIGTITLLHQTGLDDSVLKAMEGRVTQAEATRPVANAGPTPTPTSIALAQRPAGFVFRDADWAPEMVVIPAGQFLMGSPESEPVRSSNRSPQHPVHIEQAFAMGRCVVTFEDYDRYATERGVSLPSDNGWGRGRMPVINVSWDDAQAYIAWLNQKLGLTAPAGYRLPSEAEWEYAARAGTKTAYWWGSGITPDQANYDGNYVYEGGGSKGEYRQKTVRADEFKANGWGLYNVHGNVSEWVQDCWHDSYKGAPKTGRAWEEGCGEEARRVVRGGSWVNFPRNLLSANRDRDAPGIRVDIFGFRLARTF